MFDQTLFVSPVCKREKSTGQYPIVMVLSQVNTVIDKVFFTGSPITAILEIELYDQTGNVDVSKSCAFAAKCVALMQAGITMPSGQFHQMTFSPIGRHYLSSSGYLNDVKLGIIEEAILQCKQEMQCTHQVSFLLSKPARGWS